MKITREDLLGRDWGTLFTRDPATFFEGVLINLLWDKQKDKQNLDYEEIEKQKFIFERWHKYYSISLRMDIEKELKLAETIATADYQNGHIAGQIHALSGLPIIQGALGKRVDLAKVAKLLKELKAVEPIGVTSDESKTVTNSNS